MRRNLGEMWKEREGSRTIYKVQFPKGIMSYATKREALKWVKQLEKEYGI